MVAAIDLKTDMIAPVKGNLTVLYSPGHFIEYVKIPCNDYYDSCFYGDVGSLLDQITECPQTLTKIGLTCRCPIEQSSSHLHRAEFVIESTAFLSTGEFIMTMNLTTDEKDFGCLNITIAFE